MKELNGYLIVEKEMDAERIYVENNELIMEGIDFHSEEFEIHDYQLPPGQYEIVEPTESVCAEMVEHFTKGKKFIDYVNFKEPFDTALESFNSWKRKEGMKNVVVLRKLTNK